ncbi:hypothetical protein SEA_JACKIEB_79 [Streptomyces phage JackieB]|nr:hypothetical protein SEA_JACKIEB_79 [Streptomyces phage JackieB]
MPKIGAKPDNRPYNLRCRKCGCIVEKLVSRFGFTGKPVAHAYKCANPFHNCGTVEREFCEPYRAYDEPTAHAYWDGAGGSWEHPGPVEECEMPECLERHTHKALLSGDRHPGKLEHCESEECEPPFERGDVATSGDNPWGWPPVPGPGEPGDPWPPQESDRDI